MKNITHILHFPAFEFYIAKVISYHKEKIKKKEGMI